MLRLKNLRQEKGLKQIDVSNIIGITQQAYANYETGKRQPDYDTLYNLADYFNVSIDYLLGKTDIKNSNKILPDIKINFLPNDDLDKLTKEQKDTLKMLIECFMKQNKLK